MSEVDWSGELELMDGTPLVFSSIGFHAKNNPDSDGDYWIVREDGGEIFSLILEEDVREICINPNGCEEGTETQIVRNRTTPKTPLEQFARETGVTVTDENRAAIEAALAWGR